MLRLSHAHTAGSRNGNPLHPVPETHGALIRSKGNMKIVNPPQTGTWPRKLSCFYR